jgi:dTDP-4-amino-4,6-dideoxygalactose transaminase
MSNINEKNANEPAIKHPVTDIGMGRSMVGSEEIEAVTALLKNPQKLFRYRGDEKTQCALFEEEAAAKTGAKHALFVNSGTSALALCLAAWEIGPGDEVIVPAYTYIATASAVVSVGAVPVIAEIDESLGLDPQDVLKKITPYTKAIIPVHMQGVPAKLDQLRTIAAEKNLIFIEDCCQAIGVKYKGEHVGVKAHAFAWSLNYFKVITCGEGGVFFTSDDTAFAKGVNYSDPAMPMWGTDLSTGKVAPFTGGGFRGNEINAAMIRVQLKKLDTLLAHTRKLKKLLLENLNTPIHYKIQEVDDPEGDCGISFAMIAHSDVLARKLSEELLAEGLEIGSAYNSGFPDRHIYKYWDSILYKRGATRLNYPWGDPSYRGNVQYSPDMCPKTLDILARCLRLSIHMGMTGQNILEIAEAINKADKRV